MNGESLSDFVRTMQGLHAAILRADTEGKRRQAEEELAEFLRMSSRGQLQRWYDTKMAAAGRDE